MPELTERDAELLFAYIDGELAADEVTALEQRLNEDAFLRRELASLRQMVTLIHALPEAKAPRNFTLTPEMVAPKTAPPLQVLPAAEPMVAATMATAPPTLKIVDKPASRRRSTWQSFAAAAAVFVLAVGFIGVALNNSQSTPANVALAPTEATFSNVIVSQDNPTTPELQATDNFSDAAANTTALPAVATMNPTETDIIEEFARKDPTEIALTEQQTTEIQPEDATIMGAMPADAEMGIDGMGGAPDIDNQVPGFSVNPDPSMQGFAIVTLPPDALYYVQMTTTPLPPEIEPNDANPIPAVAAQMTFAPASLATTAESAEAAGETVNVQGTTTGMGDELSLTTNSDLFFTPNVRDGFLVLNGFLLLQWLLNRFVIGQP